MIPNSVIQADFISDLLGFATLTAILNTPQEVREDQYQGTKFGYPAIRVAILQQTPITEPEPCDLARLALAIRCYAEGASSLVADQMAGIVNGRLHRRYPFHGTGWYSFLRSDGLISALRVNERLWRAEALFGGVVYPTS